MTAELGVGLQGDLPLTAYAPLGRLAEDLGFAVVTSFADVGYLPPMAVLHEVARATERIRLGPSCLNPFTAHPVEIAEQIAALDGASGGRAYLGLARGAWLETIGVPQPRPVRAVREAAEIVRLLLRGDDRGYAGELFRIEAGFRLRCALPARRVPLLVGAWGPQMARLAGEIADELKVGGSANPALVPVMRGRLATGTTTIVLGAVTVVDPDAPAARARAREAVAMYVDVVAALDPTVDVAPTLLADLRERLRSGDAKGAGALIPDDLLDRFAFAGTPDDVTRRVRDVFDAGAGRVEFGAPFGLEVGRGLRLLGERVLPNFVSRS